MVEIKHMNQTKTTQCNTNQSVKKTWAK